MLLLLFLGASVGLNQAIPGRAMPAQGNNLLVNGSFEQGAPIGDAFITLQPGSTAISGWTVTRASIDYIGPLWQASDGQRSLDMDGSLGFGGIAQTFPTLPGQRYLVTFDLAGNPEGPPTVKTLGVGAAGQQATFSFDITGKSTSQMGWVGQSWAFTAIGSRTTLELYSRDTEDGYHGPALDNVAVTPLPATGPRALFAAGHGGVYRSIDGGSYWQRLTTGLPALGVDALTVADDGTLYAGAGGAGVYVSRDWGQAWQPANDNAVMPATADVTGLAVDPRHSSIVYALRSGSLAISPSGGVRWYLATPPQLAAGGRLTALAVDPANGAVLVGAADGRVFRWRGATPGWLQATGMPVDALVQALVFDPQNDNVVYAATARGLYQSLDGGATWQPVAHGFPSEAAVDAVAVNPHTPTQVFAGTDTGDIFRSTDGGTTWQQVASFGGSPAFTGLAIDPVDSHVVLAGTDEGDRVLISTDGGDTWRPINPGFGAANGLEALIATTRPDLPTDPERMPSANPPGGQYVPTTEHVVRDPFLAFYTHNGGLRVFGLPLTAVFSEGGVPVQYFERAELVLRAGAVHVAPLGSRLIAAHPFPVVPPSPSSATRLYFAGTGHSLSGRFLVFWQQHGGAALFGAPISEPFYAPNGDGTGRRYLQQYFENVRMEYHPELSSTAFAVSLGLIGRQYLQQRGWL